MTLWANNIYWHFPVLVLLVSLVYSATRFEEWNHILHHTFRSILYLVTFMGIVFVVLWLLSTVVPEIF